MREREWIWLGRKGRTKKSRGKGNYSGYVMWEQIISKKGKNKQNWKELRAIWYTLLISVKHYIEILTGIIFEFIELFTNNCHPDTIPLYNLETSLTQNFMYTRLTLTLNSLCNWGWPWTFNLTVHSPKFQN